MASHYLGIDCHFSPLTQLQHSQSPILTKEYLVFQVQNLQVLLAPVLVPQVLLYSDTASSPSHCYFTQAMLQQWPFPLCPFALAMAHGLLIGRPQSFLSFSCNPTKYRPQPQESIPTKKYRPLSPLAKLTFLLLLENISISIDTGLWWHWSKPSLWSVQKVFWRVDFDNLPETEVCFRRVAAIWPASTRMTLVHQCLPFYLLSYCTV